MTDPGHTPDETGGRPWLGRFLVGFGAVGMVLGVELMFTAFWAHGSDVLRYLLTAALSFVVGLALAFFGSVSLLADSDG